MSYATLFTFTVIRKRFYSESFPLYTSLFDPDYPVKKVGLPKHGGSGHGIARAKIAGLGETTARLVNDNVGSSVEV